MLGFFRFVLAVNTKTVGCYNSTRSAMVTRSQHTLGVFVFGVTVGILTTVLFFGTTCPSAPSETPTVTDTATVTATAQPVTAPSPTPVPPPVPVPIPTCANDVGGQWALWKKTGSHWKPTFPHFHGDTDVNEVATKLVTTAEMAAPWPQDCINEIDEPSNERLFHRKKWEFCAIIRAVKHFKVMPGKAIGFSVGTEPLPSYFASKGCKIVMTDMPMTVDERSRAGWAGTGQWASNKMSGFRRALVDEATFNASTEFAAVDLNNVPASMQQGTYDFTWSAGSLEHTGNRDASIRFAVATCRALRKGGVSVHTTEFMLSKAPGQGRGFEILNDIVLFTADDIELMAVAVKDAGCRMLDRKLFVGTHPLDRYVDFPPLQLDVHTKMWRDWESRGNHIFTSIIVIFVREEVK